MTTKPKFINLYDYEAAAKNILPKGIFDTFEYDTMVF
jgi:hypothetical protein